MKKNYIMLCTLLCIISSVGGCTKNTITFKKSDIAIYTAGGKTIPLRVELAETTEQHAQGFMKRTSIPEGSGMLFIFSADQIMSFWMKDTPSPLSIAYIDSRGRIRDIFDMTPFSLASVQSTSSVRYALEVPQGWFDKMGITIGDTVSIADLQALFSQ